MKKVLLLVAAIALFAGSVNAGPALIGLYVDGAHTNCRQDVPAPYMGFTMWVWVQPGDEGMICAEYALTVPPTFFVTGTTVNPAHSVALGDAVAGISICFPTCNTDWTWTYQHAMLPTVGGVPDFIDVAPHPDAGVTQIANCLPGYPLEPMIVFNNLGINQDCEEAIGNETSSWGAIKGMYSE
jgi:hypothetical protein